MHDKNRKRIILNSLIFILKWIVLLVTYLFLAYKLSTFKQYDVLFQHFEQITTTHYFGLLIVFVLLPLNMVLEALKWQKIVEKSERIPFNQALNAVFAGFATGFVTPNRIGEMAGRMLFISPSHRKITAIYALLNSLTQNYVIALIGLPTAVYFFLILKNNTVNFHNPFLIAVAAFVLLFTILYFFLPRLVLLFNKYDKIKSLSSISEYKIIDLLIITGYSLLRFFIFSIQFFAILHFLGVELSVFEAFISIPTSYLFVTFTPALAFSEAAIRSSYAVIFIGAFSEDMVGIAIAGFALWFINFVLPMLIGSKLVANTK